MVAVILWCTVSLFQNLIKIRLHQNENWRKKYSSNPNTDNENESLPDLKTIWECDKIIRLSTQWNCGWCGRQFSQFNENRALHHCSKINFPSPVGIGTCEAQIPSNYLQQYQKMAKKKLIQYKRKSKVKLISLTIFCLQMNA